MPDWETLRTVLAITRTRGLSGAARELGVEHSTVFRRLQQLEAQLGVRLFDRLRGGYLATAAGEVVAEAALQMEHAALDAERRVAGADTRLQGVIRVASSELLSAGLLTRVLEEFLRAHADIDIELIVSNQHADLSRREADLALRATATPPPELLGRQLAQVDYAIYAPMQWSQWPGTAAELAAARWLGLDHSLGHLQIAQWMRTQHPGVRVALRSDSLAALIKAVAAGSGIAVLPRFAAAQDIGVRQISAPLPEVHMPIWLLTHPDSRSNARVRALSQFLTERIPSELHQILAHGPCADALCCPLAGSAASRRRTRKRRGTGEARASLEVGQLPAAS